MAILRVTITEDYIVNMIDNKKTKINGWTMKQVIDDWFKNHPLDSHHASRDGHRIGNSRKLVKIEIIKE